MTKWKFDDYLIIILALVLILVVIYVIWPKPKPVKPNTDAINNNTLVLDLQHKQDSIKLISLQKISDSLKIQIKDKEREITSLKNNVSNITQKYYSERNKLKKLSSPALMEDFISQTGGKVDSIYSIPRMNLLNALEIFLIAEENTIIVKNQQEIILNQDSLINFQSVRQRILEESNEILMNSLDSHRAMLKLQGEDILQLNKDLDKKQKWNKFLTITTIASTAVVITQIITSF